MPKPIVCLSDQLLQLVEIFHSCFNKRHWKYFVIVLLRLIKCEGGGLKSNRTLRLLAEDGSRTWIKLSAYTSRLTSAAWSEVTWPSAEG